MTMVAQEISAMPTPHPDPLTMTPEQYGAAAAPFMLALATLATELETFRQQLNAVVNQAVTLSTASITSPLVPNSDNYDVFAATAQAEALTINADAGTPIDGREIVFRFCDDSTPRALTWTTGIAKSYRAVGITLPTTTTAGKTLYVFGKYNAAVSRYDMYDVKVQA